MLKQVKIAEQLRVLFELIITILDIPGNEMSWRKLADKVEEYQGLEKEYKEKLYNYFQENKMNES